MLRKSLKWILIGVLAAALMVSGFVYLQYKPIRCSGQHNFVNLVSYGEGEILYDQDHKDGFITEFKSVSDCPQLTGDLTITLSGNRGEDNAGPI